MTPRYLRSILAGAIVTIFTIPALATTQCPPEYGEKSAIVEIAGWAVLATGFLAGLVLMRYALLRSQNRPLAFRLFIPLIGIVGMAFAWLVSLLIALNWFFLTC